MQSVSFYFDPGEAKWDVCNCGFTSSSVEVRTLGLSRASSKPYQSPVPGKFARQPLLPPPPQLAP